MIVYMTDIVQIKTAIPKQPRSSLHASDVMMRGETFVTDASTLKERKWMEHNICARNSRLFEGYVLFNFVSSLF